MIDKDIRGAFMKRIARLAGPDSFARLAICVACGILSLGCASSPARGEENGALQGVVFDLDRSPVEGARIEISGSGGEATVVTDAQGRFTAQDLLPGPYLLSFSKSMYESREWPLELDDFTNAAYLRVASHWQLLDAALASLGKKELGEAEDYLARARSIQEKSSTCLFLEGVLAERRGEYPDAIAYLEEATVLDPRSPYLWLYLADLHRSYDDDRVAERDALDEYLRLKDDPVVAERRRAIGE